MHMAELNAQSGKQVALDTLPEDIASLDLRSSMSLMLDHRLDRPDVLDPRQQRRTILDSRQEMPTVPGQHQQQYSELNLHLTQSVNSGSFSGSISAYTPQDAGAGRTKSSRPAPTFRGSARSHA